jgi:hypothetical protein
MATATLSVSPSNPVRGGTVTATYTVSGNNGTPAVPGETVNVTGHAVIGGQSLDVNTSLTLPGTDAVPPLTETFAVPTASGLSFTATSNPRVFTALVP